jgi:hypothetical protein
MNFLENNVSDDGIETDPDKIDKIKNGQHLMNFIRSYHSLDIIDVSSRISAKLLDYFLN